MLKILIVGDAFLKTDIVKEVLSKTLTSKGFELFINTIEWRLEGYQGTRMMGIRREIREFTGEPSDLAKAVKDVHVIFVHTAPITMEILENAKRLKVVGVARGGPVNVDIDAATLKGIPVLYTPGRNANSVAEYVFGLIIAHLRNIVKGHTSLKNGIWRYDLYHYDASGFELAGKTLGIIGFGNIGRKVIKLARAFEMKVLVYDPYVDSEIIKEYDAKAVDMETLLESSDIVTVHAKLTPETRHLINERALRLMKQTAILVNTSRGEIVDEKALIKALKERWIAGAALDVFETEPLSQNHELLKLDNVTLTPHIAGASREAVTRSAIMLSEDLVRILSGEKPLFCANPEVLSRNHGQEYR